MKNVLQIVDLLKRQAETALARATRRKADALINIEAIKENIIEMGASKSGLSSGLIYEHWCAHQRHALEEIYLTLPELEQDVRAAFAHLETVQAKFTAAESLRAKQEHEEKLKAEAVEEDAMLELYLLRRTQA
ncbi:MAG: hypothetical protein JKX72_11135 [Robiginitomaculum sp.]|nr:hypothetical protein [Robiginitomaculum sp.]